MTQWIAHDSVDLSAHMEGPEFAPKVRRASDFAAKVKASLEGHEEDRPRHASMLLNKARGIQFRPGEVTAWVGYNGHRKSMFTSQVAVDLCVQKRKVLIVSLEMEPTETVGRMVKQTTGLGRPGVLVDRFNTWSDGKLWMFDHVGNLSIDKTLALCRYFAVDLGGTDVFLDSMMMICTSEERLDEQKQFATGLVRLAQETGLHIHIITHCRKPPGDDESKLPSRYSIRGSAAISDQAHNVMVVWMNKAKYAKLDENPADMDAHAEPCAVVKCDKQRNGKWEGKIKLWNDERSLRFCEDRLTPIQPYAFLSEVA